MNNIRANAASPWVALYPTGVGPVSQPDAHTLVEAWAARVRSSPGSDCLIYFDAVLSTRDVDQMSDALAAALADRGVGRGDRVGIHLQNVPHYPIAMLALWKLGAAVFLLNPMYMGRELEALVVDAEPVGIIATNADVAAIRESVQGTTVNWVLSVNPHDFQTRNDSRVFTSATSHPPSSDGDLLSLIKRYAGKRVATPELSADDIAFLTYTSGTTGPAKGAMNTHGNVLAVTSSFAAFANINPGDVTFALAPLFHITGAVVHAAIALVEGTSLVLTGRFYPEVALEAMQEHKATYTVGSITAYIAMMNSSIATPDHFSSFKTLYSGGAPIAPNIVEEFQSRFGHYIHNAYGMTETSSGVIAVPPNVHAPVDPTTGSLSIGIPLPNLHVEIVDKDDRSLPPGTPGELVMSGPQIVSEYWRNPAATKHAIPGGRLHSGDAAIMDENGWVYLVDRLKDQINVSGYKVWPREVEDCLYEHPAVLEAGVVGRSDSYQGESVIAYISLKPSAGSISSGEIISFVRSHLAVYKCPKEVHIVSSLPKTQTGKIKRSALRELADAGAA